MKEEILEDLKLLRDHMEFEAQEARRGGGTMAMKLGGRVKILDDAIKYIETYGSTEKV